jgi:acyl carrier protein
MFGGTDRMYEKLVKYAAKQLEIDASEIRPDSTFESLGIDSLDIVEMIMDLESELGVELDMEDQKITTFQELADFVESKLN